MFVVVHERQLDPKGRLALPAAFRPRLEPRCYLAFGRDKCIDVLTAEAFEQVAQEMLEKVRNGEMSLNERRALAANTIEVTIDAQGRINIDEKLRSYAGVVLGEKVVVAGFFWYPSGGYCGWHTNSNNTGERYYLVWAEESEKSFFRYQDPNTQEIITNWDQSGWQLRNFAASETNPTWHCVGSETNRVSIGFQVL